MSPHEATLDPAEFRPPTPRRWRASGTIRASVALHAASLSALALDPATWPWVFGAIGANHSLLTGAGFVPRSALLGPNLRRLPPDAAERGEVALTFDDGPDSEVTPRGLDLLDAWQAKATFFVVGERAREHSKLMREIVHRGHAVENHTDIHSVHFAWYGPKRLTRELGAAQRAIADACGMAPVFFRAPMGFRTPFLEPVLSRLGLHLASWTRRGFDTVESDPRTVVDRLTHNLAGGDILLLHDGIAVIRASRSTTLASLPLLLQHLHDRNLHSVTLRAGCRNARLS
jgi:peptidoglycan/xylan/chitin deacetylase (PgdA/CDA1 family)